jgi:hypothetical protein
VDTPPDTPPAAPTPPPDPLCYQADSTRAPRDAGCGPPEPLRSSPHSSRSYSATSCLLRFPSVFLPLPPKTKKKTGGGWSGVVGRAEECCGADPEWTNRLEWEWVGTLLAFLVLLQQSRLARFLLVRSVFVLALPSTSRSSCSLSSRSLSLLFVFRPARLLCDSSVCKARDVPNSVRFAVHDVLRGTNTLFHESTFSLVSPLHNNDTSGTLVAQTPQVQPEPQKTPRRACVPRDCSTVGLARFLPAYRADERYLRADERYL